MVRELITCWEDYQTAIGRLLYMACEKVCIYDADLSRFNLESALHLPQIQRVLQAGQRNSLQIIVRDANLLHHHSSRLLKLLTDFSDRTSAQQSPPDLAHLRDSLLIIDDQHALIRFERDLPRSKLLIDEAVELKPYLNRFSELYAAGGDSIRANMLGL